MSFQTNPKLNRIGFDRYCDWMCDMNKFFRTFVHQFQSLDKPARLLLIAFFLDGLLFSGYSLFFNLYIIEAGYSRDFLGLINAAPSLSALLLGVPMGMLSDRIGRKTSMLLGFSLANFAILGMLISHSEPIMIGLAFLFGMVGQLYALSHAPFMMKVSNDANRDILFSFSYAMFPLASTLGSFLAGYLPGIFRNSFHFNSSATAYQGTLIFCVIASFLVLVPIAFIKEAKTTHSSSEKQIEVKRTSVWKVLFRPLTIKLALPNLVIGLGAATLVPYFNVFFSERHKMTDSSLGILFSVGSLAIGIACILGPRIVGNLGGKIKTVVLGQLASLGFLLLIGFSPWAWLAIIGYLARGALMNMVAPLFDAYALELTDEHEHGAVNSIRNLAWNVGWAIGPYISGLVQQRWGFAPLFINTAILYGAGVIMTWVFFRPKTVELKNIFLPNQGK